VARGYWLDLFTGTTWEEFLAAGGEVSGFRERRWKTVQQMKPGDYLLCYLTGISRWIGVLEVASAAFKDSTPIWKDEQFPCRVRVEPVATLTPETAVPVFELRDQLSVFNDLKNPNAWTGHFRGSPARWKPADGQAVVAAVLDAKENPVARPVDAAKLARRPRALKAAIGPVTVPDREEPSQPPQQAPEEEAAAAAREPTAHTEVQWRLLKLGNDMGLDVWVARNDRGRDWQGHRFAELPRLRADLPLQFDEATNRTIELIDVLWLKGNAVVAAFEIESTTSIYSGLLRMSDLIAMQPNLNIPLYLVAPDERRQKVFAEVNRPTFSRLSPPLVELCRFIAFSALRDHLGQVRSFVRYLKPEFLDEVSESCVLEDA
jgi:predicted RNA-binding protein